MSLRYENKEMITRSPMPIYWRAMIDNDKGANHGFRCGQWLQASMFQRCSDVQVIEDDHSITVEYTYIVPTVIEVKVKVAYTVYGNSEIKVIGSEFLGVKMS